MLVEAGDSHAREGHRVQRGEQRRAANNRGDTGGSDQIDGDVLLGPTAQIGEDAVGEQPHHRDRRKSDHGPKFKNQRQRPGQ